MWRAWSENCAKNPENLRGQDFAKSEDMRGQTRSFGAQTVSSHVFNAKSCPLRFSRNLRKALRPGTPHHIHARRRRKGKRKFDKLTLSTPLDTYFSMSHSQAFQTQGDTLPHKANAIL